MVRSMKSLLAALILVIAFAIPVSAANVPYQGTISDSYIDYFESVLSDVSIFDDYVFWRSGENTYSMLTGDIEVTESGIFTLSGEGDLYQINLNYVDGASQWQQNSYHTYQHFIGIEDYTLDTSYGYFVYSSLDGYPKLEGRGNIYEFATLFVLVIIGLCCLAYRLFKFCLRRGSNEFSN